MKLSGPQSLSGCGSEETNSSPLPGFIQPLALRYATENMSRGGGEFWGHSKPSRLIAESSEKDDHEM